MTMGEKKLSHYFSLALVIFSGSVLLGWLTGEFVDFRMEYRVPNESFSNVNTFIEILTNNSKVLLILASGLILFRIPTVLNLIVNGGILGLVMNGLKSDHLLSTHILSLLAHGIVEILAFLLVAMIALAGIPYIKKNRGVSLLFVMASVVLLVVAAFIETFVSVKI